MVKAYVSKFSTGKLSLTVRHPLRRDEVSVFDRVATMLGIRAEMNIGVPTVVSWADGGVTSALVFNIDLSARIQFGAGELRLLGGRDDRSLKNEDHSDHIDLSCLVERCTFRLRLPVHLQPTLLNIDLN